MYRVVILISIIGLLTACGSQDNLEAGEALAYEVVQEAQLNAGDSVAAPTGEVILTITGAINNTNVGDTLQFDIQTLEQLMLIEYLVNDYQAEGSEATFRGVLLSDVLALAGIDEDATTLNTIALNDYAVDIPIEDTVTYPVMIATSVDGERMSIERYGPTRVIYPNLSYEIDGTLYDQRWIWQLSTIEVQ